jgi:hypothetical protein
MISFAMPSAAASAAGFPRELLRVARAGTGRPARRRATWARTALALTVCLLFHTTLAFADGPFEPNNDIAQTTGPIAGDQTLSGTLETGTDADWYRLHLVGGRQVTFARNALTSQCFRARYSILNYDGSEIYGVGLGGAGTGEYKWTTPPGGGTYYVRWQAFQTGGEGCSYEFSVSPADALSLDETPALPEQAATEPNEDDGQAFGPLLADRLYTGVIDTNNDRDVLFFNALPQRNVTVEVTAPGSCSFRVAHEVSGPFESGLSDVSMDANLRSIRTFRSAIWGGRYAVSITGELNCRWQVRISPGDVLSPVPVVPQQAGSTSLTGAPGLVLGQTHQGGDHPAEFWSVPMFKGDRLDLSWTNLSERAQVALFPGTTTDVNRKDAKPEAEVEASSEGTRGFSLVARSSGAKFMQVTRDGDGLSLLGAFSFVPIQIRHVTKLNLGRPPRRVNRGTRLSVVARVASLAGAPAGRCVFSLLQRGKRSRGVSAKVRKGRCRAKLRPLTLGQTTIRASFVPRAGWLSSRKTSTRFRVVSPPRRPNATAAGPLTGGAGSSGASHVVSSTSRLAS